jgi:hypothetical protein
MRDPRLQNELFDARQKALIQQTTRDRLASSLGSERTVLGDVLAALGRALLALRLQLRLRGARVSAPQGPPTYLASHDGYREQAIGHHPEWTADTGQAEAAATATATSTLVALNRCPTPSKACP